MELVAKVRDSAIEDLKKRVKDVVWMNDALKCALMFCVLFVLNLLLKY